MSSDFDIFINNSIFPDADKIFSTTVDPSNIRLNCIFVIDTNALLVPYYTSTKDLVAIKMAFEKAINESRLIIPGQVAREFAKNRPEKIKEIYMQLSRKLNTISLFQVKKYPLLSGITEYQDLIDIETTYNADADDFRKRYKTKLDQVLNKIKEWTWNDPVSSIYRDLFKQNVVYDFEIDKEEIRKELERRYSHNIPPGFKDKSKPDDGIGDLLIWLTILKIGKEKNKSVVFVSGEEKSDWFHNTEGQSLYPRFELVNEFHQHSPNNSFHIIKFSEFLDLMDTSREVTREVEDIEKHVIHLKDEDINDLVDFLFQEKQSDTISNSQYLSTSISPVVDVKDDLNWQHPFIEISEKDFLYYLGRSLHKFPFVGLHSFIIKYLGSLGYDYKSCYAMKDKLAKDGKIETYIHYPESTKYKPVEALRILPKGFK